MNFVYRIATWWGKNKSLDRPIGAAETNGLSISHTLFLLLARSMLLQAFHLFCEGSIFWQEQLAELLPHPVYAHICVLHCTVFWKSLQQPR